MSAADLSAVRKLLPRLSAEEVRTLRVLLAEYHGPASGGSPNIDWYLSGVKDELRRRGLGCPPLTVEFVRKQAPQALHNIPVVREVLVQSCARNVASPHLSTTQWLALGRVCAHELARWLVKREILLAARTLLSNSERIPQTLDMAFPGYLQAGMLHLLVRAREPNGERT